MCLTNFGIFKVYPRVKVRAYEQEDCLSPQDDRKAGLFSRSSASESPSMQAQAGSGSPGTLELPNMQISAVGRFLKMGSFSG